MSITRKGRENYCFVSFDDCDEATEFMTRYNHQQLREFKQSRAREYVVPAIVARTKGLGGCA